MTALICFGPLVLNGGRPDLSHKTQHKQSVVLCELKQRLCGTTAEILHSCGGAIETGCGSREGATHTLTHSQRAPGLLPACIVSDERVRIFLRCLFNAKLRILPWFLVSTPLCTFSEKEAERGCDRLD